MKTVLSIATILGLCASAGADCRARVRVPPTYAPAVAVYATPVLQYQNYYVASYSGLTASTEAVLAQRFDILGQKLDAFTLRLEQALQQGQAPQQAKVHPGAAYLGNSCVRCHDAQVAKAKGGGFTFFNLNQLIATPEQQWSMSKRIRLGEMPPAPAQKATDDEYGAVLEFFENAVAQRAAKQPAKMPLAK